MDMAFRYIKAHNGLDSEASYPYAEKVSVLQHIFVIQRAFYIYVYIYIPNMTSVEFQDGICHSTKINVGSTDRTTGYADVRSGDENALKMAVATVGPISVAIDASDYSFQFYEGGIYHPWKCNSTNLDHGVLVCGYGSSNGKDYWLVKNR